MLPHFRQEWDSLFTEDVNYYYHTAGKPFRVHALDEVVEADVCIVGGGFSGLATAYQLAKHSYKVVVLERHHVGWGASGRNGGQLLAGYTREVEDIIAKVGLERAQRLWQLSCDGVNIMRGIIAEHDIHCDLKKGYMDVAKERSEGRWLKANAEQMARDFNYHVQVSDDPAVVAQKTGSENYVCISEDSFGGHLHPLKYIYGMARVLKKKGVRIFHHTPAEAVLEREGSFHIYTPTGRVKASKVVLCGDAYMGNLYPELRRRYILIRNGIIATEPLKNELGVLPEGHAVCESNTFFNYYRKSADNRLLFGGGEFIKPLPSPIVNNKRILGGLAQELVNTFPQLKGVKIDYRWGGYIAATTSFMPNVGRLQNGLYYINGFSGHGLNVSHLMGKLITDHIIGRDDGDLELFQLFHNATIPGQGNWDSFFARLGLKFHYWRDKLYLHTGL